MLFSHLFLIERSKRWVDEREEHVEKLLSLSPRITFVNSLNIRLLKIDITFANSKYLSK